MIPCLLSFVATGIVLASQDKQCGRVQVEKNGPSDRVLGGHVAQKRNWPWLVEISKCKPKCDGCTRRQCFLCTGTLVSDRHVLTAAHCFEGIEPEYTKRSNSTVVEVRSHRSVDKGYSYEKTNLKVHPKYDYEYAFPAYDVAIVELIDPTIKFSDYDQPICIVDSFRENIGEVAYVAGYGSPSVNRTVDVSSGNVPKWNITFNPDDGEARENIVQFRTMERCASVTRPLDSITRHSEKTICAVGNKRDTAKGDSGGPLMINQYGVWYQIGTTSIGTLFKDDDGQTKWFSLYSRLSRACDWIEEVTSGGVKCVAMED